MTSKKNFDNRISRARVQYGMPIYVYTRGKKFLAKITRVFGCRVWRWTNKKYRNKAGLQDLPEDFPTTVTWWKRKRHEDYPASAAGVILHSSHNRCKVVFVPFSFSTMFL